VLLRVVAKFGFVYTALPTTLSGQGSRIFSRPSLAMKWPGVVEGPGEVGDPLLGESRIPLYHAGMPAMLVCLSRKTNLLPGDSLAPTAQAPSWPDRPTSRFSKNGKPIYHIHGPPSTFWK